jgi:hypothetical protein
MFDRMLTKRWRIILAGTLIAAAPLLGLALFADSLVTRVACLCTALMILVIGWLVHERAELINSIKTASDELLQVDMINKAYGDTLTLINQNWFLMEDLTQAVLAQLNTHVTIMAGVCYLLQENGLVPLSSTGIPLPPAAGEMVLDAMKRNEIVNQCTFPGDSVFCMSNGGEIIAPYEVIAIPLRVNNVVVAMLELASRHGFGETELRIINRIAPLFGIGINQKKLEQNFMRHSIQLETANYELLTRVESGKMELKLSTFPLRETVEASLMILREKAFKKGVELNMDLSRQADVIIVADKRKLKQIMFNLLSNAVTFTPKGGTVYVSVLRDGDFIEITVADTGAGIREADIPGIFQAFTPHESLSTEEFKGTGLGLGLAMTKQLVELHGGRIWLESEFEVGSRFTFTIPQTLSAWKNTMQNPEPTDTGDTYNATQNSDS